MSNRTMMQSATYLIAAIFMLILSFPLYALIMTSFKPLQEIFDFSLFPKSFTWENYKLVMQRNFEKNIWNSIIVAGGVTIVSMLFHSMAGYALARFSFPGKKFIFAAILCTLMIPFAVIMIPLFLVVKALHLTDTLWGVMIPSIPFAYGIFLLRQFYLGFPAELEEAARIDGSSYFGTYWRLALPLSKSMIFTMAVAIFLHNWNMYLWPLIVITNQDLWVVQVAISSFVGERSVEWNLILAASCIATLPVVALFIYFQKYLVEGIKMTGIKE